MKKVLAILLVLALVFSFAACGSKEDTSSDTGASSTITSTEGDKTSSETTNNESTGDATTSDATSDSSSEQNTSKPTTSTTSKPTDTSKPITSTPPSTSKPTDTSKPTETHTHTWGNWSIETEALIGKDGTEKRTCSSCKEVERRSTKENAMENSFSDDNISWLFYGISASYRGNYEITADGLVQYACSYAGHLDNKSSTSVFDFLSKRFTLTDTLKSQMKTHQFYNSSTDTFNLEYSGSGGNIRVLEYANNGGNKYTVTYGFSRFEWDMDTGVTIKVSLEYNLLQNKPNKYLSFEIKEW